jgi:iron complex transport system substrate-binding protein
LYKSLRFSPLLMFLLLAACVAPLPTPAITPVAAPVAAAPTANLTEGCVTAFDPAVDYFPEKATLTHTEGFAIDYFRHYKVITVHTPFPGGEAQQYVLVQCGAPTPEGFAEEQIIQVPVNSIVTMSTTFLTALDEIGVLDRLVGLDEATYVNNPRVRQMADAGKLTMIGVGAGVNVEQVLDLNPDLIMTISTGNAEFDAHPKLLEAGLKVVLNAEWLDTSPLGRAEWSKFIAAFFNREATAETLFAERVARYDELAALAATAETQPTVFVNTFSRNAWSIPGGNSYIARFLADAGANYLWAGETTNERLQLSFEEVYDVAHGAEFWVNTGRNATTLAELLAEDARYADFAAVQRGNVWNNNARLGPSGGNEYWEVGVAHPDVVLADLIKIFHPALLPEHELVYYRPLR